MLFFAGGRLIGRCGFDAAGEGSVREARGDFVAGGNLCRGANQRALGGENQGVAAVEDGQGRERVEAGVEGADADGGALQGAFEGAVEAGAAGLEALAGLGEALAGIVAKESGGEIGEVGLMLAELGGEGGFKAK